MKIVFSSIQKLELAISKCDSAILYQPLFGEINYCNVSLPINLPSLNFILPISKNSNPFVLADLCILKYKNNNPYILIPGTKFDVYGTRHGKGGGWYDRFLSNIPKKWLRIGICNLSQLSISPILRNEWDEPVDWLLVYDDSTWKIYEIDAREM